MVAEIAPGESGHRVVYVNEAFTRTYRFKSVNDRHGHDAGDCVLMRFAEVMVEAKASSHYAARTGGEEFSLLCPATTQAEAKHVADEILRRLRDAPIRISAATQVRVTCSAGVSGLIPFSDVSLAIRADNALYRAKRAGRDRTILAGSGERELDLAG